MPWLSLLKCKLCFKCLFNILRNVKFYKINKSRLFVTYFKLVDKKIVQDRKLSSIELCILE